MVAAGLHLVDRIAWAFLLNTDRMLLITVACIQSLVSSLAKMGPEGSL